MAVKERLDDSAGAVSPAESTLLSQLDPDGMPMADLARLVGVSTPAIHQTVHRLETLGLLEVAPNPQSGRSKLVLLTPEGFTRRQEAMKLLSDLEDELAHRIGRRRVTALRDALEQDWGDTTDGNQLLINYRYEPNRVPAAAAGRRGRASSAPTPWAPPRPCPSTTSRAAAYGRADRRKYP